jgi:hypothetical protein
MASLLYGIPGYLAGSIADQTQLLQDIKDGLSIYNQSPSPVVQIHAEDTIREVKRVSQSPLKFSRMADGGVAENSKQAYRLVQTPLESFDLSPEFTLLGLQDALPSDIDATMKGAMAGDVALVEAKFFECLLTKRTASVAGTASRTSFYNGETDVPQYKDNVFSSAHYHYLGANQLTIDLALWRSTKKDIQEHGYGLLPGTMHAYINSAQEADVMGLVNSASNILQAPTQNRQAAVDYGLRNGRGNIIIEGVEVHVDDNVPTGYFCMVASDVQSVAKRVHLNPAYQGLQEFRATPNLEYPLMGLKFVRRIGFSAQILGAATARQLVASTTYTNPTFNQLS